MKDSIPKRGERALVPHPDDEADVRAGLDESERGDTLSADESEAYVRGLLNDEPAKK